MLRDLVPCGLVLLAASALAGGASHAAPPDPREMARLALTRYSQFPPDADIMNPRYYGPAIALAAMYEVRS